MTFTLRAAVPLLVGLAALLAFGVLAPPAAAWERHDLITRVILRNAPWLDAYKKIEVLPASGSDCLTCDKDLYNPDYIPLFIDKLPGERTSAREILVRYVDEPDWGMDEKVEVSLLQPLAGGSKGYRHQYYYFAGGLARVGAAPKRVQHFYDLAMEAYKAGDRYWAFRQLARALHYLEDMGQPLHTRAFNYSWLKRTKLDLERTTTLATNLHYAYERMVVNLLREETRQDRGPLLEALRKPPKLKFDASGGIFSKPPEQAAWSLAEFSSNKAAKLLNDLDAFLPKRVKSTKKVIVPTPGELVPTKPSNPYLHIHATTVSGLSVTSGAVISVLEMARRDFAKIDKERSLEE